MGKIGPVCYFLFRGLGRNLGTWEFEFFGVVLCNLKYIQHFQVPIVFYV
jgi:hypothetical protein